eukprot:gene1466-1703_t
MPPKPALTPTYRINVGTSTIKPDYFPKEDAGSPNQNTIVIGGTGATGKELVKELIASNKIAHITSIVRRKDDSIADEQVVVDMEKLEERKDLFANHDVAFCTIGTTKKQAGSAEAFRHIDYGYSTTFSRLAKEANVQSMHLLTSTGANANSWFLYMKTKGEIEEEMKRQQFKSLSIYRPAKLEQVIIEDMEKLEERKEVFANHDVAFCTLGTTRKQAGSAEAFRHIEYDFSTTFSRLAKEANVQSMHLLTSAFSNANSWFLYMKTKGEIEEEMKRQQFKSLSIYRPGALDRGIGDRPWENVLHRIIPSIPVSKVAKNL